LPQCWIAEAMFLLTLNGTDETTSYISFGGCLDEGIAIANVVVCLVFEIADATIQAFKNILSFFGDVCQLTV
jgi:hypothetical protein